SISSTPGWSGWPSITPPRTSGLMYVTRRRATWCAPGSPAGKSIPSPRRSTRHGTSRNWTPPARCCARSGRHSSCAGPTARRCATCWNSPASRSPPNTATSTAAHPATPPSRSGSPARRRNASGNAATTGSGGEAVHALRRDADDQPAGARRVLRRVDAEVAVSEPVGQRPLGVLDQLRRPADVDRAVGVLQVKDREADARVAGQVARLLAPVGDGDQQVIALALEPDHRGVRAAVLIERRQRGKVLPVEDLPCEVVEFRGHRCVPFTSSLTVHRPSERKRDRESSNPVMDSDRHAGRSGLQYGEPE